MSIASEITRLQAAKAELKTAIENKGVTVPSNTKLDGYADLVDSIQAGGSIEDLIAKENLVRIEILIANTLFILDEDNNFNKINSYSLLNGDIVSIKLIFVDLELVYYPYNASPTFGSGSIKNFLIVAGVEFSILYRADSDKVYCTLYYNNEQIGYLESPRD